MVILLTQDDLDYEELVVILTNFTIPFIVPPPFNSDLSYSPPYNLYPYKCPSAFPPPQPLSPWKKPSPSTAFPSLLYKLSFVHSLPT